MIIEIENYKGERLCALNVNPFDEDEQMPIIEDTIGNVSIADYDIDDIFNTNDYKLRVSLDDVGKSVFRSGNIIGFYHKEQDVKDLIQEYKSYQALIKSFEEKEYYNCGVLIENYFGHIDYWYHFGYNKTHEEIAMILFSTLLSELNYPGMKENAKPFHDFCQRMMRKIEYELKENFDITDIEKTYQEGFLP